jgi:glutamate-1-semialdehyde 2,1-aminomutase
MVELVDGKTVNRPGPGGPGRRPDQAHGEGVEFNDLAALEAALATGRRGRVLTEPVMTNSCMVLPARASTTGCAPDAPPARC